MEKVNEIILKGTSVFELVRKVVNQKNQYDLFRNLMETDVFICTKGKSTEIMLLPNCNCRHCSAAKEIVIKYFSDEISRDKMMDSIDQLSKFGKSH